MSVPGTITVNDRPRPLAEGAGIAELLRELGLEGKRGLAVAVNGSVVPRSQWPDRRLKPADRVLLIQATQGG